MRPPSVFVRPLLHEEAVRLKRLSDAPSTRATRQRASVFSLRTCGCRCADRGDVAYRPVLGTEGDSEFNSADGQLCALAIGAGVPTGITTEQRQRIVSGGRCPSDAQGCR